MNFYFSKISCKIFHLTCRAFLSILICNNHQKKEGNVNYSFFHRLKSKKTWWAHIIIINKNVCALKFKFYALNK